MPDMLINLYEQDYNKINKLDQSIKIKRALAPNRSKIVNFVSKNFDENFADECTASLANNPPTCFIAIKNYEIIGFICYEATAKNFVGPMGIIKSERGKGLGEVLMLTCLKSMKEMGYGYAIIGSSSMKNVKFHQHVTNAKIIESKTNGIYSRMIESD